MRVLTGVFALAIVFSLGMPNVMASDDVSSVVFKVQPANPTTGAIAKTLNELAWSLRDTVGVSRTEINHVNRTVTAWYEPKEITVLELSTVASSWGFDSNVSSIGTGVMVAQYNNMGLIHMVNNNMGEAIVAFDQAIDEAQQGWGNTHPVIATLKTNLAAIYVKQENPKKAETLYVQALEILEGAFGMDSPDYVAAKESYVTALGENLDSKAGATP